MAVDLVAGTLAGFAICAVGHPFDTVKVLMQSQSGKFPGVLAAARDTLANHGPAGFYRGVTSPLLGSGLYTAVQFFVFGMARRLATDEGRKSTLPRIGAAAAITGVFVALVEGVRPGPRVRSVSNPKRAWRAGGQGQINDIWRRGQREADERYRGRRRCNNETEKRRGRRHFVGSVVLDSAGRSEGAIERLDSRTSPLSPRRLSSAFVLSGVEKCMHRKEEEADRLAT